MRLAHLSDIHILDLQGLRPWHLGPKRASGALNLLLNRSKSHAREPVEAALRQIDALEVDHVVVTGDLSNLALDSEFAAARGMLAELGDGRHLSVIPGNHDTYTAGSVRAQRFERVFEPWMRSDLDLDGQTPYPFVKFLSDVALIGLCTGFPTAPLFATGEVGAAQLGRLEALLEHPRVRASFVVVAFHHHVLPPPRVKRRSEWMRRLRDAELLLDVLKRGQVGLGIHGHTHQFSLSSHIHPNAETFLHVAAAGSASIVQHADEIKAGKYNVYDIDTRTDDGHGSPRLARITTYLYHHELGRFEKWRVRDFDRLSKR